jgi:hypothetical protein
MRGLFRDNLTIFVKISVYKLNPFSLIFENVLVSNRDFVGTDLNPFFSKYNSGIRENKLRLLVLSELLLIILEYAGIAKD